MSDVKSISVFDGNTGKGFVIDDLTEIKFIVENIQGIEMKRDKISVGYSGYCFRISFNNSNGEEIDSFVINSVNTIRDDPFFYRCNGGLCFDYLKELEEKTLEASLEADMAAKSESKAEMMMDFYGSVEVSELDYDSFQSRMSDEEWEGFQQYLPLLKENAVFHYTNFDDGEELNKSGESLKEGEYRLYERYMSEETMDINRYVESYSEDGVAKMKVEEIRVFDLDGDGVQALAAGNVFGLITGAGWRKCYLKKIGENIM